MNNTKNRILVFLAIAAFSNGAAAQYFEPEAMAFAQTDIPFSFIGVFLSFWWYYLDSQQIEFKRGKLLNIGIITIGLLAFPYYFFRSRGFKTGFIYTSLFIVVVISWSVLYSGGEQLVYYVVQS
jgi:hypothetical protein